MIDKNSDEYKRAAISLAFSYCPRIYPCAKCGHPVVDGYCCDGCNDSNPKYTKEQEEE